MALCKPTIRRCAKAGDVVIAVTPAADGHRLSSWAKITKRISTEEFSKRFPKRRPDNIYEKLSNGKFARRPGVKHEQHSKPNEKSHDLGAKGQSAFVLISQDFFAFGESAVEFAEWIDNLPRLRGEITKLGRALRRYFSPDVERELMRLERSLKKEFSRFHNEGFEPRDPGLKLPCETGAEEKKYTCLGRKMK